MLGSRTHDPLRASALSAGWIASATLPQLGSRHSHIWEPHLVSLIVKATPIYWSQPHLWGLCLFRGPGFYSRALSVLCFIHVYKSRPFSFCCLSLFFLQRILIVPRDLMESIY